MVWRESHLKSLSCEVREESSLLAPEPPKEGDVPSASPRLFTRRHSVHYRYQSTHKEVRKEDIDPNPEDGHRGVQVFDGQYELEYHLVSDPAKQQKQMGIVGLGFNDNYSPLLFGYWSPADTSPIGSKQAAWSAFVETSELVSLRDVHDPVFGPTAVLSIKRTDGVTAELWLARNHRFFPFKVALSKVDKDGSDTYSVLTTAFKMVEGLPVATKASYDQATMSHGFTIERERAELQISSININDPKFAINFAPPEGTRFGKYIEGEEQGVFTIKNGKLAKADIGETPDEERSNRNRYFAVIGGVGGVAGLATTLLLYRRLTRRTTSDRPEPQSVPGAHET